MPGSSNWSLSLRFLHQNPVCTLSSHLLHTCYMPCPFHSSSFVHMNNIWWAIQIIKLLIMQFSPLPCFLIPIRLQVFSPAPYSQTYSAYVPPQCEQPKPIQNNSQNYGSIYLNLYIFG
jgi:hypothetical protein